jgi:hypothetical protein
MRIIFLYFPTYLSLSSTLNSFIINVFTCLIFTLFNNLKSFSLIVRIISVISKIKSVIVRIKSVIILIKSVIIWIKSVIVGIKSEVIGIILDFILRQKKMVKYYIASISPLNDY